MAMAIITGDGDGDPIALTSEDPIAGDATATPGDITGDFTGDLTASAGDPVASELGDPSEPTADLSVSSSDFGSSTKVSLQETPNLLGATTPSPPLPAAQGVGASEPQHERGGSSHAQFTQSNDASEGRDDGENLEEFMISPSRFSPLQDIDEEEETCLEGSGTEVEEGEFPENKVDGKKEKELQVASRSRQQGSVPRQLRGRVTGSKDKSNGGRHG
ncbi:hypothetical protein HID58_075592, partial [Brassica napus]